MAKSGSVAAPLSKRMFDTFMKQGAYCPADPRWPTRIRPNYRLWHRQAYAAAGTANKISFFNAAGSPFVTNMLQASALPRDHWFKVWAVGIRVVAGMGLDGSQNAANANESAISAPAALAAAAVATNNAQLIAEQMLRIHRSGRCVFSIGDIPYVDRMGIDSLPWGGGPSVEGNMGIDNATTAAVSSHYSAAFLSTNNGAPVQSNQVRFRTPLVIPPQQTFGLDVTFQTALALTGGGVIEVYLEGDYYTARNQ